MHSGKLNWTEQLNWTELDRSVQFSAVHWTGDDRRRPSQVLLTVKNWRRPSPVVAARRRFLSDDRHCIDWPIHDHESVPRLWRTCDDRQFRRRINAQRETELNWTELNWTGDVMTYLRVCFSDPAGFLSSIFSQQSTRHTTRSAAQSTRQWKIAVTSWPCDELTGSQLSWVEFSFSLCIGLQLSWNRYCDQH